jgi:hypothetical protein
MDENLEATTPDWGPVKRILFRVTRGFHWISEYPFNR